MEIDTAKLREEWNKYVKDMEGRPYAGDPTLDFWLKILLQREKDLVGEIEKFMKDNRSVIVQGIVNSNGRLFAEIEIKDSSEEVALFTKEAIEKFLSTINNKTK